MVRVYVLKKRNFNFEMRLGEERTGYECFLELFEENYFIKLV